MSQRKQSGRISWHSRVVNGSDVLTARKNNALLINGDSRDLLKRFPSESVDCIVTSPPYGALKDYGSGIQLGYGQDYSAQYLPDLDGVLEQLFRIAKNGAALWLVLDTIKKNGESLLLPWELGRRAKKCGWTLHDVVVWDKGKSLPWSHRGRFRGVCEFLVLLGKGKLKTYNLNAARDYDDLSSYWVKYPERYSPEGKAPSDLWHFPIPIQGSWSKENLRHFCPFPSALISRILSISTKRGHVVLDPFSGTGSVVAVAAALGRSGLGIELNRRFVKKFRASGYDAFIQEFERTKKSEGGKSLAKLLRKLRLLKYPKSLFVEISRDDRLGDVAGKTVTAFVLRNVRVTDKQGVWVSGQMDVLISNVKNASRVRREIATCMKVPPLSKFGVEIRLRVVLPKVWRGSAYRNALQGNSWYQYTNGRFYKFARKVEKTILDFETGNVRQKRKIKRKYPPIFSVIQMGLSSFD